MVVTGDRDAYQLVERRRADHDHLPRDHRHPGLRPRGRDRPLRDPAGARPRLHRPEGRHHATTSPASPGSATRPPPSCCSEFGDARGGAGAHRQDLRRQAQGEPDQPRRRRAHLQAARHRQARHARRARPAEYVAQPPGPLEAARHLPRVRAARAAAPPRGGARLGRRRPRRRRRRRGGHRARARSTVADVRRLPGDRGGDRGRARRTTPQDQLFAADAALELRRARRRRRRGARRRLRRPRASSSLQIGKRAGDRARRQVAGRGAGRCSRTTPRSRAYLLEPARRAYPFRELCEERGFAAAVEGRGRRATRCWSRALAALAARGDPRRAA